MFRKWFFSIFLFPCIVAASPLSTIGSAGSGSSLYACATVRTANPNPSSGKSHVHVTQCHKVAEQDMQPDPKKALALAPDTGVSDVIASFFWYRNSADTHNAEKMATLCASYRSHFGDCEWTKTQEASLEVLEQAPQVVKDLMSLKVEDLTTSEHLGCAVALCLANPGGWKSVGECHEPVQKLFRVLAATRQFPQCKM